MTLLNDLIIVLLTYVYVVLTIIIPVQLKKRDKISKFTARKTVHLLAGLAILVTPLFTYPAFALLIAGPLTILVFFSSKESKVELLKDLYDSIGEEEEEKLKRKFLQGPFNYCLSITILVAIFIFLAPNQLYFAMAGILIMIIADTMASVVGKRWGKITIKLPWTGKRTLLGSTTMFSFSFILSFGSYWYFGLFNPLTQIPLTWDIILLYSFITALLATIIEILSPSTWDDMTVPIGTTIIIYLLTFIYL